MQRQVNVARKRWVPLVILAVVIALLGFLAARIVEQGGNESYRRVAAEPGAGGDAVNLLGAGRTHFSLCVDAAGGLAASTEQQALVRESLEHALAGREVPAEFRQFEVVRGCPAARALSGTPQGYYERNRLEGTGVIVDEAEASIHHTHVYFVGLNLYSTYFGGEEHARTTEEFSCVGDLCLAATRGLYVPEDI